MLDYTLIIPILNKPNILGNLLRSIDKEELPKKLIIIDNGDAKVNEDIYELIAWIKNYGIYADVDIEHWINCKNFGVAGSWNYGVENSETPWVISNFDMVFKKGTIKELISHLEQGADIVTMPQGYCLFACRQSLFDKIGYFDRNFYPAYMEDTDFDRRVVLHGGVKKAVTSPDIAVHQGCQTVQGHHGKILGDYLWECHSLNQIYYIKKWGGKLGEETYKTPFNKDVPLSYWKRDENLMRYKKELWEEKIND